LREGFSLQAKNGSITCEDLVDYMTDWGAAMTNVDPDYFLTILRQFWNVDC